jgi:tRNA dimethylallyltransferase
MNKIKTVFVVGPTASGKTGLGIKLAKEFGGEVISADSMQIYKGIHIASAAPDIEETEGVPHHLIEFLETNQQFSVADYVRLAREKIKEIAARGNLPIVVGGTGLYIKALVENTDFLETETDVELRGRLEEQYETQGGEEMLRLLREFDEETANRLHPNDKKRIIRAFEVYYSAGKTVTEQNAQSHNNESFIEPLILGLTYDNREKLYDRINLRVDLMLQKGLLEEAENSFKETDSKGGFQAIGHKELYGYFKGELTIEEAAENLKQQTRRYAKRQLTWFRNTENINWIYADLCENPEGIAEEIAAEFLK